ncbi:hypothetical protein CFP56_040729 [Quercus suber]|uniref:Aminotransferase-like plant mobile domain-containing protein n=1 Tax=Quercus suber TaxID=58331 RepID=A0AAW0IXW6_QUESU
MPNYASHHIRPGTFKIASSMANGHSFGLPAPVLASIYRGLNTISSSPTPSKSGASFAIHYVYAWLAHFFRSNRITNDKLSDPLMTKYSGVGYASPFIARSQGTKGSLVVPAKNAIEISEEKVCNDLDYNWKHSKSPIRGVDAETSIDHAPLLTNSESSISKPFAESSDFKRRKFADVGTSSKLPTETGNTFFSSLQATNPPEVSMFQAMVHVSSMRRKGASMLGDVLLNKLSTLSVDNILPQVEINEIYSGIESLGVDPWHLREHVDKHCEGVADFLRMKESLNKRPSPVNLIQHEAEIELLPPSQMKHL